MLEDSRVDVQGEGEYRAAFIDKLNQRSADYAGFGFNDSEGGSFAMRCRLGDRVQATMGERDRIPEPAHPMTRSEESYPAQVGQGLELPAYCNLNLGPKKVA